MTIKKDQLNKALDSLEELAKSSAGSAKDQGANPPLNSAEGSDMGVPRGKPMSDEAKKKKESHGNADYSDKGKDMSKKSFADDLPEEVTETIDVSEFLKSLVDHVGAKHDDLRGEIAKSELAQATANEEFAAKLEGIEKSQAMIGIVLKSVCEKLGILENAPAHAPKSETTVQKSEVAEKKFEQQDETVEKGGEEKGEKLFKSLSNNPMIAKSQVSEALCDLVKSGEAADTDVISFEMNNYIAPHLVSKLKAKLD